MGKRRDDRIVVQVDSEDKAVLCEWKRICLFSYGNGGIKKRLMEIINEDIKKLKREKSIPKNSLNEACER